MTVEAFTETPIYTVSGVGPYAVQHPYVTGAIAVMVIVDDERVALVGSEFSVTPLASDTTGDVFLSPTAAATHAGRMLVIDRVTPDEQGYLAVTGERETALMAQLDRMTYSIQEIRKSLGGGLRIRGNLEPFDWVDGTVPLRDGDRVISGPTAAEIAAAQLRATEAAAAASAAAASAAEALAKQNSMLRDRGAWVASTLYSLSDIFTFSGTSYITQVAHIATTVAADLAANRIRVFAAKGDAGAGTGDMLKTDNLSGLASYPSARSNMGLGALAVKATAAFADIDPLAIVTDVETLLANKVNNAWPTAKAVTDYIDAYVPVKIAFNGVPLSGTYSRTGTLITVTMTAHGMTTGQLAQLDFTTGTGTDGSYVVTVLNANQFQVTDAASGSTSGNVTRQTQLLSGRGVYSIVRNGTGDYTIYFNTPFANGNYVVHADCAKPNDTNWTYWAEPRSPGDILAATIRLRTGYVSGTAAGNYNAAADNARVYLTIFSL